MTALSLTSPLTVLILLYCNRFIAAVDSMEQSKEAVNNAGNKIFLNINHSLDNFKNSSDGVRLEAWSGRRELSAVIVLSVIKTRGGVYFYHLVPHIRIIDDTLD